MSECPEVLDSAACARWYQEQQPQLVAYARSLTGDPWLAEDLVAEACFRVWRRYLGHAVDDVPGRLAATVRGLVEAEASPAEVGAAGGAADGGLVLDGAGIRITAGVGDPGRRIAWVGLLSRVLGQLPERWVGALWLAEAEGLPVDVRRARHGMRKAFLREHPGLPADPACSVHWNRIPAHILEAHSPNQANDLRSHLDGCADCRSRLAVLTRADGRLPGLVGPALLAFALGGPGAFLSPLMRGGPVGGAGSSHGMCSPWKRGSPGRTGVSGRGGARRVGRAVASRGDAPQGFSRTIFPGEARDTRSSHPRIGER